MASYLRFMHCAQFRFDSPFWEGPAKWVAQRNQDLWQTFEAALSLCRSEKVEFLFLTGNLFEQEYVHKETVERVARSFANLDGTRIFIIPGKRDPLVLTSAYRLAVWPGNVHIFSGSISHVNIPSRNVTVYGAGWTTYRQEEPFLGESFQAAGDGTIGFMLLHAPVDSVDNGEGFIPIRSGQIASSGFDYLALGHQENWSGIQKAGKTYWADCGSPEARNFRERGPHGVILGEIGKESARFEFHELGQRRYIEKVLAIQSNMEALVDKFLAATSRQERQKDLFRIILQGSFSELAEREKAVQTLQNLLETEFSYVEILTGESQFRSDVMTKADSLAGNRGGYPTLFQVFINKIQERLVASKNTEKYGYWKLVEKIGLAALGQGREDDEN